MSGKKLNGAVWAEAHQIVTNAITRARRGNSQLGASQLANAALLDLDGAGYLLAVLPTPDAVGDWGWVWERTALGDFQALPTGQIVIRDDYEHEYSPAELEAAGLALLAASAAARDLVRGIAGSAVGR